MPHHKEDPGSGLDVTRVLPADVTQNVLGPYLPNSDVLSMYRTAKKLKGFFQSRVDALQPLKYVVEGDVDALMELIQENPGLLFKKGNAKAPRGQIYYNASPYMLMKFLCDEDMLAKIMALIPECFNWVRQAQNAEIGQGGSDLVVVDFDPMSVTNDEFNKICAFKTRVNVWGTPTVITFPLLENPDGLLCWKDPQGTVNFYYANREEQTVIPIIPVASTPEERKALDVFKDSFDAMENNSARRSTNKEHQLIAKLMQRTLHRQGIRYNDAHGEYYCDSHTPFQLINRYRTSMRLYDEASHNERWEKAHHYWQESVGMAQGEEMWLLQRICEANRPFYPLPQNFDHFKRGFGFYNFVTREYKSVFNSVGLVDKLGSNFALYKGRGRQRGGAMTATRSGREDGDLIAVCRLVEEAKTKTIGLALEADKTCQPTSGPQY